MRFSAILLALTMLTACTTRMGDLTVATPKNLPGEFKVVRKGLTGKGCAYQILFIPLGTLNPTVDGAIDNLLEQVDDADAVTDASIYNDLLIALIYNSNCIRIEGTAVRTR